VLLVPSFAEAQADLTGQLERQIARSRRLIAADPDSHAAYYSLATLENAKADLLNDRNARRLAARHFIRAAELALERGEVRYTSEVRNALVALNDRARLDDIFSRILRVAESIGADRYLALVDYAAGLASFNRPEADARFEEAIRLRPYPDNNHEAIGRYAQHLLARGDARKALAVIELMSPEHRIMNGAPVFLRKRALAQLGLDTSSADAEIDLVLRRGTPVQGGVRAPEVRRQR
jgi:tetratricopeptide (TPR) repeat protein